MVSVSGPALERPNGTRGLRWAIYTRISVDKGKRGDDEGDTVSLETQDAG